MADENETTSAPNQPETPENPKPQEPNVSPNPAAPQNPTPPVSNPPTGPVADPADVINAINALPERLANMLLERNPPKQSETPPAEKKEGESESPGNVNASWEVKFAKWWTG